jgi:macrolide transport system ATP-binding/permease protein
MTRLRIFFTRLRGMFGKSRSDDQLSSELRAHLDALMEENIRRGMSTEEARYAARREFGGLEQTKQAYRYQRGLPMFETLLQDLHYAMRMLRKSPGFTIVAVLTLALGIGGNTAIFSLIDAVMLRALPVREPRQLVLLQWSAHKSPSYHQSMNYGDCGVNRLGGDNPSGCSFSHPFVNELRSQTDVFSGLAVLAEAGQLDLSGNGPASLIRGQYVSGDFFQTLGVQPSLGRTFVPADDAPSAPPVAVLNYGYWQSAFGGSPSAVGKSINLNGVAFTIIGVAEPRFVSLAPGKFHDIWIPLSQRPGLTPHWDPKQDDAGSVWLVVVGRLRPGIPRAQAQTAVSLLFRNELLHGEKPLLEAADNPEITLMSAQDGFVGLRARYSTILYVLMLAVGIVLLIACANVASLLLSRAAARQKEMAVRLALGAGRARILRQLLTESLMLSVMGGALGVLLAQWGVHAILAFVFSSASRPGGLVVEINWRVVAFTAAVSVFTGILFGLAPALRGMRVDLTPALKEGAELSGGSHNRISWLTAGDALVVVQVALTIVVLVGAGLLVRTLQNLRSIDPGFDTRSVLTFEIDATLSGYKDPKVDSLYRDLQDQFAALPGVISSSYSQMTLLSGSLMTTSFHLPGTSGDSEADADMLAVGPKFFQTMRISFVAGRDFFPADYSTAAASSPSPATMGPPVPAVVNETFVRRYFNKVNPLGQRFGGSEKTEPGETPDPGWQIIGVVRDAKYNSLRREIQPTAYVPQLRGDAQFEVRTAMDPSSLVPAVRNVVNHLDSNLPVFDVETQTETIDRLLFQERFIARFSSFFGLLALTLACVGLYGLLSYEVARRTREIGVRMALGAQQINVLRLVVGRGIGLALAGTAIGSLVAFGITRFLASMLYEVRPNDPVTLIGVAALLLLVALAACYSPARRAMRVDPMVALRYE